jgi:hypothetical protein
MRAFMCQPASELRPNVPHDKENHMNTRFHCAAALAVVAGLSAACDGASGSPSVTPTAPSATSSPAAVSSITSEAMTAQVAAECGISSQPGGPGSPDKITNGTPPPPGGGAGAVVINPDTGAPGLVTSPGGGDPTGGSAVLAGDVQSVAGSYPSLVLRIGDTTVRTSASTTFQGVSAGAITQGSRVGAAGTIQSDRSVAATCVVGL